MLSIKKIIIFIDLFFKKNWFFEIQNMHLLYDHQFIILTFLYTTILNILFEKNIILT